jgi:CubicO group peptidase (beta-lactamase class C family)
MRGLLVLLVACGAPAAPAAPAVDHITNIEHGLRPAIEIKGEPVRNSLEARMRELKIHAVSIAVFENYKLSWARAYGEADTGVPASPETLFQAGSISKSVNALAALEAVADGTLSLDAPINDSLTSWKLPDNDLTKQTPVTLRRILSHTAGTTVHGFPGYEAGTPLPTIQQVLDGTPPANTEAIRVDLAPGTKFRYSGGGITIAQLALTERSKQPYPEILAKRVLGPLGMTHSTYEQPLPDALVVHAAAGFHQDGTIVPGKRHVYPEMAAAGLWTTPSDLAVFFAELAMARANRSTKVPHAIAMEMTTKVADLGEGTHDAISLGTFLIDRNGSGVVYFGHNGADEGFQADALASLDGGYGIVIMANSDNGGRIFSEIESAVFAEYGWKGAVAPLERFAMTDEQRTKFVGRYLDPIGGVALIDAVGGKLQMRSPFGKTIELVPVAADTTVDVTNGLRYEAGASGLTLVIPHGPRIPLVQLAPDARDPLLELEAGHADAAVALWRDQIKAHPETALESEGRLNQLGYEMIGGDTPKNGVAVLLLVVTVFPDSSNAHDSYADALLHTGDKPHSLEEFQRAIDTIDADPRVPAGEKAKRRAFQEDRLRSAKR